MNCTGQEDLFNFKKELLPTGGFLLLSSGSLADVSVPGRRNFSSPAIEELV